MSDSQFVKGLRNAERRLTSLGASVAKFGAKVAGLGAAVAGPILAFAKEFSTFGDDVQKAAIRTGLAAEAISELGFAAAQSGSDIAGMEAGIRGMQRALLNAASGSKETVDALAAIGLSIEQIQNLGTEDQFYAIADGLAQVSNDSQRAGLAMRLLGKSGSQLLPLMEDGARGIKLLREEAQSLGLSISREDADSAAELNDAMGRFTSTFKAARVQIGAAVTGVLVPFFNTSAKIIANLIDWAKENRSLVQSIFLIGSGVAAIGTGIIALGGAIALTGVAMGGLATAIGVVGSVIGALLSPIGLVIAALAGLGALAVKAFGSFSGVIDFISGKIGTLSDSFGTAIDVIKTALTSGDLSTAAQVLWASLKAVWERGVFELNKTWIGWKNFFLGVFIEVTADLAGIFTTTLAGLQTAWVQSWNFIQDAFDLVKTGIINGFLLLGQVVLDVIAKIQAGIDYVFGTNLAASIDDAIAKLEELRQSANESFIERVGDRDRQRQDQLATIERDRQGTLDELERERQRKQQALSGADAAGVEDAQRKLDEALAAYGKTISDAKAKQQADLQEGLKVPDFSGIEEGLAEVSAKAPSRAPQFGGLRAEQIFGTGPEDQLGIAKKQLEVTQQTQKDIKKIAQATAAGSLVFGT